MFLAGMSNPSVSPAPRTSTPPGTGTDWKALGYLVSIVSVFLLGSIAWPKAGEPGWHMPVLVLGMATSILGMAFRYKAHLDQQRELRKTEAEASRR
jgi:hypothetical protein